MASTIRRIMKSSTTYAFESNVRATVKALFRAGDPAGKGKPASTSFVRANGGWFGPQQTAPNVPRDAAVLGEEDEDRHVAALERNGCRRATTVFISTLIRIAVPAADRTANQRLGWPREAITTLLTLANISGHRVRGTRAICQCLPLMPAAKLRRPLQHHTSP